MPRRPTDLEDELRFHVEKRVTELMAQGMSRAEAERAARARLGNVRDLTEFNRDMNPHITRQRALSSLRSVVAGMAHVVAALPQDVRHAVKSLRRARGFTVTSVGTLGFGLALCVSVAAAVNTYLIRGLPYPKSERLYNVSLSTPGVNPPRDAETLDWSSLGDIVELPIAWDLDSFTLRGEPYPEAAQGTWVTPGYMAGFGIRPALGRAFEPGDFEPGAPLVAIISHRLWQSRFGGDPAALGRRFESYFNDRPGEVSSFTIIGVLPPDFWHMQAFTEILAPLKAPTFPYLVRLHADVPPDVAAGRITALVRSANTMPAEWRAELRSTHEAYVSSVRPLLLSLTAAAGLVLLIATANVGVLLLVRATARHRELVVRKALGASWFQVARGIIAEAAVLGLAATTLGLTMAQVLLTSMAPFVERQLGRAAPGGPSALEIDGLVLAGAAIGGLFVVLVCSIVPLLAARRAPAAIALGAGQKGASAGPAQQRARAGLIVVEVAACLALLVGAALMVQSGLRILQRGVGLDARDVIVGLLGLRPSTYPDAPARVSFYERSQAAVLATPGVRGTAFTDSWPLQQLTPRDVGPDVPTPTGTTPAGHIAVTSGYFDLLGVPVLDGRTFTSDDRIGGVPVAVISESLAHRLWPQERAVGRRLRVGPSPNAPPGSPSASYDVVGVVGDTRDSHSDPDAADVYVSLSQLSSPFVFFYVGTHGAVPSIDRDIRTALAKVDPDLVWAMTRPLGDILDRQRAGTRFLAQVLVVFAGLAAVLAVVGIYGVISYTVRQRRREIAVRIAIGASTGAITRLFVRQGVVTLVLGLGLGIVGALALGSVLRSQLYDVNPADPMLIVAVTAAFAVCGLFAILWPARSAASTDPAEALRD